MPVIRYVASVLLYILLLPISTPAAFVVSTWTGYSFRLLKSSFNAIGKLHSKSLPELLTYLRLRREYS